MHHGFHLRAIEFKSQALQYCIFVNEFSYIYFPACSIDTNWYQKTNPLIKSHHFISFPFCFKLHHFFSTSGVQFWTEIIHVISNWTRAARSSDFEITRMISDQIALYSVQLPLFFNWTRRTIFSILICITRNSPSILSSHTINHSYLSPYLQLDQHIKHTNGNIS